MNKSYTVIYSKKSKKFIEKHRKEGVIFYKIFEELSINRENMLYYDIKSLVNEDKYRLRVGKYRATFKIVDNELIILIINIDSRGPIYKKI